MPQSLKGGGATASLAARRGPRLLRRASARPRRLPRSPRAGRRPSSPRKRTSPGRRPRPSRTTSR
eukprot:3107883-Lingulodinium_polyedra.AAC.1